jgi:triphosphoribosyl-dephospho-CoA synthase
MPLYAPLTRICETLPVDQLTQAFTLGARRELLLTPKPGLVDLLDNGSHDDLDLVVMQRSIDLLPLYYQELLEVPLNPVDPQQLRAIGLRAEERMLEHCGTNTHRGYLFLSGVLLMALRQARDLRSTITRLSQTLFAVQTTPRASHGERCRQQYRCQGIIGECLQGMPALFEHGLPCYRQYRSQGYDECHAGLALMARLMQVVDDTTCYHRGGAAGVEQVRRDGETLERLIAADGDIDPWLAQCNQRYREQNLTMGGIADMIALTYAVDSLLQQEVSI